MTNCDKRCGSCPNAKKQKDRIYCVFYGIQIWRKEKQNEKTTARHDADLRGLREGNPPDARMDL